MTRRVACWLVGLVGLAPFSLIGLGGCTRAPDLWEGVAGSPRVVVTIPPLYSFVKGVAPDAAVKCLCETSGPHHYETTDQDIHLLRQADLFFAVGLKLDDKFADPLSRASGNPRLRFVELGERLPGRLLLKNQEHEHEEEKPGHKEEPGHEHEHGEFDPHVWLGTEQVVAMARVIRDELKKVDPAHADDYDKNGDKYVAALEGLQSTGREQLAKKKNKRIISFHDSLQYFARSFGLKIADVIELTPGDEPDATHLSRIVELCRDKGHPIAAIAVEPQYPKSTSAQTVQKELKSKGAPVPPLVQVDPLETAGPKELREEGADWYVKRMRRNLEALSSKLP
jgi:ABC-type Zn uptake system ZnuABC Zn-binding protein ZnuA